MRELYDYKDYEDGIEITYYKGDSKVVNIPDYIENKPVLKLGKKEKRMAQNEIEPYIGSFQNKGLEKVILPKHLKVIDENVFKGSDLSEIRLPDSLEEIKPGAFFDNKIDTLWLPDSVKTIGYGAFHNNGLTRVRFGKGLKTIERAAFYSNNLTEVILNDGLKQIEGHCFAYNESEIKLAYYPKSLTFLGAFQFMETNLNELFFCSPKIETHRFIDAFDTGINRVYCIDSIRLNKSESFHKLNSIELDEVYKRAKKLSFLK